MVLSGYCNSVCHAIEKSNYTALRQRVKIAVKNDVRRIAMGILWPGGLLQGDEIVDSIVDAVYKSCHYRE